MKRGRSGGKIVSGLLLGLLIAGAETDIQRFTSGVSVNRYANLDVNSF